MHPSELSDTDLRDIPITDRLGLLAAVYDGKPGVLLVDHAEAVPSPEFKQAYINLEVFVPQEDGLEAHCVLKTPNKPGYEGRLLKTFDLRVALMDMADEWPEGLADVIGFPEIIRYDGKTDTLLETFVETQSIGSNHGVEKGSLSVDDVRHIADAARFIQRVGHTLIRSEEGIEKYRHFRISVPWVPIADEHGTWQDKYHVDMYNNDARVNRLSYVLGEATVTVMKSQLDDDNTKRLFRDTAPKFFVFGNLIPGKLGKDESGKIWVLDLERCCHTPNPASDTIAFFSTLWSEPQLQEEFFRYSIDLNQDISDYREYARLDFIFNRGSGELNYFLEEIERMNAESVDHESERYKACEQARDRYIALMQDAVNRDGIWKNSS